MDRDLRLNVRSRIAAFEHQGTSPASQGLPQNQPQTPSRRAAIAARRVTRSQLAAAAWEEGDAPKDSYVNAEAWPELRERKVLFESLSTNEQGQKVQPSASAETTSRGKRRGSPIQKAQKTLEGIPSSTAENVDMTEFETVKYPSAFDAPADQHAVVQSSHPENEEMPSTPKGARNQSLADPSSGGRSRRRPRSTAEIILPISQSKAVTPPEKLADRSIRAPQTPSKSSKRGSKQLTEDARQSDETTDTALIDMAEPLRPIRTPTRASARLAALAQQDQSPKTGAGTPGTLQKKLDFAPPSAKHNGAQKHEKTPETSGLFDKSPRVRPGAELADGYIDADRPSHGNALSLAANGTVVTPSSTQKRKRVEAETEGNDVEPNPATGLRYKKRRPRLVIEPTPVKKLVMRKNVEDKMDTDDNTKVDSMGVDTAGRDQYDEGTERDSRSSEDDGEEKGWLLSVWYRAARTLGLR